MFMTDLVSPAPFGGSRWGIYDDRGEIIYNPAYAVYFRDLHRVCRKMNEATLSVQACLLDPRGPEVALKELAERFMREIENEGL